MQVPSILCVPVVLSASLPAQTFTDVAAQAGVTFGGAQHERLILA